MQEIESHQPFGLSLSKASYARGIRTFTTKRTCAHISRNGHYPSKQD